MDESKDKARALEEGLCLDPERSPTSLSQPSTTTKFLQGTVLTEGERGVNFASPGVSASPLYNAEPGRRNRRHCFSFFWPSSPEKPSNDPAPQSKIYDIIVRQLESCPKGYPHLAAFLDSDENFMVYRRFGYLQSRLLLEKQDELRKLERKLDLIDDYNKTANPTLLQMRDLTEEEGAAPRRALFTQIEERFREYTSLLITAQHLVSFNKPASGDYKSVINYMKEVEPVTQKERDWVRHLEDLVTLRNGREHAWLDSGIEHLLQFFQQRLGLKKIVEHLFCSTETKKKCRSGGVYYSRGRINRAASGIIIFTILALLVIPIYILYYLVADVGTSRAYAICIGVLLVSTLAFSAVISLFTRARRHEILAAAAAYCATLVVFIGNVGGNAGGNVGKNAPWWH
ncbi:hypothetical protein EV356DRAFT_293280 [Viridothelium virens]|uniref:DUF6594 domain-containing protein n=1 Tax=Viridothelium virens TaxID=1048519 RepID=A0A6A6H0B0_VIRVR|nr:hypothetical protein EV356DRAFT_293280 [Viridothelium virens]